MTESDNADYLWNKRYEALYKAELSALYHQKRERFFEMCDKLSKAASLFGGSAALWKATSPEFVAAVGAAITLASALSLVFSFSDRSKRHAELASNFRVVIADIVAKGERVQDFSEQDVNSWLSRVYGLEAKEPPALSALIVMCQNELAIARDAKASSRKQSLCRRLLVHFFDMPLAT